MSSLRHPPEKHHRSYAERAEEILGRCERLARFTDEPGCITRTFLSPAMEDCLRLVSTWMEAAGMEVAVDRAGNLRGVLHPDAPLRLMIGSHLDTVPNAGRYDGILGVLLGIALAEAVGETHPLLGLEVIGFSDEEGVRYGLPFVGSRALVGRLGPPQLAREDANGIPMATALAAFADTHPEAIEAVIHPATRAYLEFHIEQGPVLEDAGLALGVVDAIAGQTRATLTFRGRAGHAGTTPMALRRDALTGAAEWLLAAETLAAETPGLVATTGRIAAEPGAINVIPGLARCSLDLRHAQDAVRTAAFTRLKSEAEAIAQRRHLEVAITLELDQPAVELYAGLAILSDSALLAASQPPFRIVSGAGHDAMILAEQLPSAMLFLRSPGGISHHPDEAVKAVDVARALEAGVAWLELFEARFTA
ncbi:allantoate amidohydrolase [Silvibacterium sp.]|uniref:allantoate amidohydrolase n=1 Tax=Silvibacterium sp. TaxID=1964179 RepID=UPI0039E6C865